MNNTTIKVLKNYVLFLFLFMGIQLGSAQCPSVIWADEFSGNTLDTTKWNYQIGDGCAEGICGWGNAELQSYQQNNVTVSNGTLKITAKKERIRGSQYTSGRINSKAKGDFTYGRFEASIKLPLGDGLWPAFWMLSTNETYGTWPQSGEIDIMEFVASDPSKILGYIHYGDLYPNNQSQGNTYTLQNGVYPDAFHEFAIEWEPGEIRWFMDGMLYSVKKTEDLAPFNWPFDQDFHFLLNVAVGGNLGGTVNNNMLPATMEVDYVRVYDGFKSYMDGPQVVLHQAQGETFSIANVPNNTNVTWTVPQGASIVSGQGSETIVVDFGSESGLVSASFNDGCQNQNKNLFVEVEPLFVKASTFENFDEPATVSLGTPTGVLTEVTNPAPTALNSSALSGKYVRNGGEQYDILPYNLSTITDASDYVVKNKKFYMDVYTDALIGTEIIIQLETSTATPSNYPIGRHSRYVATVTESNNWQRLIFRLLDQPDSSASPTDVGTMILLFNSNSFTSNTYYFDNLDTYDASTGVGPSNQSPTVAITNPTDGTTIAQGTIVSITADASDTDGSVAQVEFFVNGSSIGIDSTSPYSLDWQVATGSATLTAVATDNENAATTSTPIGITGQASGDPTSVHVSSIVMGTADAGKGKKYGTATVNILDNQGSFVSGATVIATFSGSFSEQVSAITNENGVAVLQTVASAKGAVTLAACVDNVTNTALPYDPSQNVVICSGSSAKTASTTSEASEEDPILALNNEISFVVYPNPAKDIVKVSLEGFGPTTMLKVYTLNGTIMLKKNLIGSEGQIDISTLPEGLYIVKLQDEKNHIRSFRLIK